jgi:hypothetical protein
MPRIEKQMLKTPSGSFTIGSCRTAAEEKMEMTVFKDDAVLFTEFVTDIFDAIEVEYVTVAGCGDALPFTKDDFLRYAFTAMCSRVRRVNNDRSMIAGERFEIRCDDPWQLPAAIAAVINSVGRVTLENPVITIEPAWNHAYDNLVLNQRQWHRVTQQLRAVSRAENMKLVLVNALAGDRSGDEMLMSLIPVRDEMGRIVQIAHRTTPVDPIAAAVYIISGFDPEIYAGVSLALHPLLLPPYYVTVGALRQNLWRLTDAA